MTSDHTLMVVPSAMYRGVARSGHLASFTVRTFAAIPFTLRHYRAEVMRLLADITWGNGAIIVGGGTIGVMVILGLATGAAVGIEGFAALDILGMAPLTGFVSAYANTREIAPLIAATAFASQAGCRFTAQLGSMRISEEIDALEVMAIRSIPYLVTTRVIAAVLMILPLYVLAMVTNFVATSVVINQVYGQASGTYEHYFEAFLIPGDVPLSILKATVFVVIATILHCYYGFNAAGGPEGVGEAAGKAIRASIIGMVVTSMFMTMWFWGFDPGMRVAG